MMQSRGHSNPAPLLPQTGGMVRRVTGATCMSNYECFYKGKRISVQAETSYAAQQKAAAIFKARKSYDVTVVMADVPVDPASL